MIIPRSRFWASVCAGRWQSQAWSSEFVPEKNFFLGQKLLGELVHVCVNRANSVFSQVLAEVLTGIPAMDDNRSPVYLVREPVTSFSQL